MEELRALHTKNGWLHAAVALRQALVLVALFVLGLGATDWWLWGPAALLQGFVILSFIILLHDVIHECVFARRNPRATRVLALLYALPSAIASSQFARWHLDHHKELGSATADPKRNRLSPKRNARWFKALYMTPALFFIYARASAAEAATYEAPLRRRIAFERLLNVVAHLALATWVVMSFGWDALLRAYVVPVFFCFPIAFMINRLGQHYWVDSTDPAKWGTRVDGGPLTNLLFLNSNLHLEHHYFPGVPLYRLPALNRRLHPFWESIEHPSRTYRQLLWGWFVRNEEAHTDWQ